MYSFVRRNIKTRITYKSKRKDLNSAMPNAIAFKVYLIKNEHVQDGIKPEIRRFSVDSDVVSNFVYLHETLQAVFPDIRGKRFTVAWTDGEGDNITISSSEELQIALRETQNSSIRKFNVTLHSNYEADMPQMYSRNFNTSSNSKSDHNKLHLGIICDGCDKSVYGFCYKCLQCDDYDLCHDCEAKALHPEHLMIRLSVVLVQWRKHGKSLSLQFIPISPEETEETQSMSHKIPAKKHTFHDIDLKGAPTNDSEDDHITISSSEELQIALTEIQNSPIRKFDVTLHSNYEDDMSEMHSQNFNTSSNSKSDHNKLHVGITCDGCEKSVFGFRYKCLQCVDYDLCRDCEAKSLHPEHFMIRLPVPVQWRTHEKRISSKFIQISREVEENEETLFTSHKIPTKKDRFHGIDLKGALTDVIHPLCNRKRTYQQQKRQAKIRASKRKAKCVF